MIKKKLIRRCPVCNALDGEILQHIDLHLPTEMNIPGEYDVVVCEECGATFADTAVSDDQLANMYCKNNKYEHDTDVDRELHSRMTEYLYEVIEPFVNKNDNLLDVGCGDGGNLFYLQERGYPNLAGVEIDPNQIKRIIQCGIQGYAASVYSEVPAEMKKRFSFIMANQVFEHLLYPSIAVDRLIDYLAPGGTILIDTPSALGFPVFLREIPNYFNPEHINYFTPKSLDSLMKSKGFKRISSDELAYRPTPLETPEITCYLFYKKEAGVGNNSIPYAFSYDDSGARAISAYYENIGKKDRRQIAVVKKIVSDGRKIVVWGTRSFARHVFGSNPAFIENVACFVDNNVDEQGKKVFGKNVFSPEKIREYPDAVIIICVMLNPSSVKRQIFQMGLGNVCVTLADF